MRQDIDRELEERTTPAAPIRVLLLDDHFDSLTLRATILRRHGYETLTAQTVEEAQAQLGACDIAVLDYHLGAGKFGTEVAAELRATRPHVPIVILSAVLERRFGGVEDMHLLKGHSSVEDLLRALRSFRAKRNGRPVVVDARRFHYSRIALAMGNDVVLEIMDRDGDWQYVNETCAALFGRKPAWFVGRNAFEERPEMGGDWREIIATVADTRETYIDRTVRGLPGLPTPAPSKLTGIPSSLVWTVLVFPLVLHDKRDGVVLSARLIDRR